MKERDMLFVFVGILVGVLVSYTFSIISDSKKCPDYKYRKYVYDDKVTVIAGFYKGQTGHIRGRKGFYSKGCFVPHFKVDTYLIDEYIPQYDLRVDRSVK